MHLYISRCFYHAIRRLKMRSCYALSYDKLWHRLIDLKLKKKDLLERTKLSANVLAKMGRGESVTLETLAKICVALNCDIGDVVDIIRNHPGRE